MENRNSLDRLVLAAAQKIKERDYWLNRLAGDLEKTTFPYDYSHKSDRNQKSLPAEIKFRFTPTLFSKAMKLSNGLDTKLHMILVTGLVILLHHYTDNRKNDIVIGSPILKQKFDGDFINTVLVFRNRVENHIPFKKLLLQVRETIIDANENQNYPIELLPDQLNLPAAGSEFPLFDVALVLENLHDKRYIKDTYYNMLFSFLKTGEGIEGAIGYNSLLYREDTVKRIRDHYFNLLDRGLSDVNVLLSDIEIMSEQEKKHILFDFNHAYPGSGAPPPEKTLHELVEKQVERTPHHVALIGQIPISNVFGGMHLTYEELNKTSGRLANRLNEKGAGSDAIVAIMADPSIEMMIGLLAILKAGAAYLPIDPDFPEERIRYLLKDSRAKMLVTTGTLVEEGEKDFEIVFLHTPFSLAPLNPDLPNFLTSQPPNFPLFPATGHRPPATSLAYIIYTSGTTAKPKGVMVEHRNVTAYLHAFYSEFAITSRDTVIQLSSYAFDAFVEEVFPLLLRGGKIVIPRISDMVDMNLLSRLIRKQVVTMIDCTPLLLNELNRLPGDNRLENVRLFISGGDLLKVEYVDNLLNTGRVYNTYGPTETTVCATYYPLSPSQPDQSTVPIGKPVAGYRVVILDGNRKPVPIGISGELSVSGPGITRGYLNNPELTAEKFVLIFNRYYRSYKSSRSYILYRTGDLARWQSDGNIRFLGRIDHQVKIRGYRIESGEIESQLRRHEGVKEAVVTAVTDESGDKDLCAYVVPARSEEETPDTAVVLRNYLLQRLPGYMVPAYFVLIDQIPLNQNGKVDKRKLPAPQAASTHRYVPPGKPLEAQLAVIFSRILNLSPEKIGMNDDFFELGGNSLKLIKLTTVLQEQFKARLPLAQLLQNCSVGEISRLILGNTFTDTEEEVVILLNQAKPRKLFCFPPGIAYGAAYMELALLLEDYSVYAFNFDDENQNVEVYVDTIIQIQPQGPLVLLAYSAGGRLCLKTAEILEKRGREVSDLILMECFLHGKKLNKDEIEKMAENFFANFKKMLLDLGMESLTEKAIKKIKNYVGFLNRLTDFQPVRANIHFIKDGDKKDPEEPLGWERLTAGEYIVYNGFGRHDGMLGPGFVEKNAGIINKILGEKGV